MPDSAQSVNRLTERVHAAIRVSARGTGIERVLVACSGGADSTCLAHAAAVTAAAAGWAVTISHVRHGIRVGDERDVHTVRALADRLRLPFRSLALDEHAHSDGRPVAEDRLRTLRYGALFVLAEEIGAQALLTGHTMDDQAETVLLHLVRGAGIDGLAGVAPDSVLSVRDDSAADRSTETPRSLQVVRPLLAIRHAETIAYCAAHGLPIVHDPTNDDQTWTRNWLRHTVMPELRTRNPDIAGTLARAATHLALDAAFLGEETLRALERCGHRCGDGVSRIHHSAFAREPAALRFRMIRHIARLQTGAVPAAPTVQSAAAMLSTARSSRIARFGALSCAIVRDEMILGSSGAVQAWILNDATASAPLHTGYARLSIGVPHIFDPPPGTRRVYSCVVRAISGDRDARPDPDCVQESALTLPAEAALTIRTRAPGDRFRPVGRVHSLRLQDYLTERKVPALVRDWLPLLVVNDTIAWVIGHDFGADCGAARAEATHVALLWRRDA